MEGNNVNWMGANKNQGEWNAMKKKQTKIMYHVPISLAGAIFAII